MGSTLLDLRVLSAAEYNDINRFEEQQTINQNQLRGIGEIYVGTNMQDEYGAGILHRHPPLREGYAMVHTRYDNDVDICKAEKVKGSDSHDIVGHSFFLNSNGQWQAYEYAFGQRCPKSLPNTEFLHRLRSFLVENELTSLVAILAEGNHQDSVEFLLSDEQGMICIPCEETYDAVDGTGSSVITGWKFYEDSDGRIGWKERKSCDPQENGQHKVKDASTLIDGA